MNDFNDMQSEDWQRLLAKTLRSLELAREKVQELEALVSLLEKEMAGEEP